MTGMRTPRNLRLTGATRREWTLLLGAAPLLAQPPSSPSPAPSTSEGLQKAKDDVRHISERLAKLEVPMNVEPAFAFRP
jgi:hypothetical protein